MLRIEKYKAEDGYRWRLVKTGKSQRILADGSEAYSTMSNLSAAVKRFLNGVRKDNLTIRDLTKPQ